MIALRDMISTCRLLQHITIDAVLVQLLEKQTGDTGSHMWTQQLLKYECGLGSLEDGQDFVSNSGTIAGIASKRTCYSENFIDQYFGQ